MDQAITGPPLKSTAWRLGMSTGYHEKALASDPPSDAQRASFRTTYRDLTRK